MKYPITHNMPQGSEEWFNIRLGKVTASNFGTAIAKPGSTRTLYMRRLIAERLTGEPQVTYKNGNMERGTELEPSAREYYAVLNDCLIKEIGFIEVNEDVGVSPDGLIGDEGGVEIKCPLPSTHIDYILGDREIAVYRPQVQGCMWATGRKWIDFVSYCPEVKRRPIWIHRVMRDEQKIAEIEVKVDIFIKEMKEQINKITGTEF
jgi:hypothetical protein